MSKLTKNGTEQAIGRMKMRTRTVRGYKTKEGMLAGPLVSACRGNPEYDFADR
jgi:hypothetical protein